LFNHILIAASITIGATLFAGIVLIKKNYYVGASIIFIFLYVIGQIMGYGLGVDILKAVVPSFSDPENGLAYQVITSTIFPLIIAFIIDYIYKILNK